jgi:DNA-binding LytR/AlgR family response regulator
MALAVIERSIGGQITVINTDQITYLRQDAYGTSIHFTSGEHVNCPMEMDDLLETLNGRTPETLLIKQNS